MRRNAPIPVMDTVPEVVKTNIAQGDPIDINEAKQNLLKWTAILKKKLRDCIGLYNMYLYSGYCVIGEHPEYDWYQVG